MPKFEKGDTVYSKADGTKMTVVSTERMGPDTELLVTTEWVAEGKTKPARAAFFASYLSKDADEQVALEFGAQPEQVLDWAERFPERVSP
jgi:hypothetical protein